MMTAAEYNRVKHFEVVGIDPPEAGPLRADRRPSPWPLSQSSASAAAQRPPRQVEPPRMRQGVNMTTSDCRFGFRIVGGCFENRRLVDAAAALLGSCRCRSALRTRQGSYLSAFWFGEDFRRHLEDNQGSTAGYSGPCWSPWLWFDLDSEELHYAHKDAAALAVFLVERYAVEPDELLIFFSGSKGFHVGLPTALWSPAPSDVFHKVCRRFAEHVAELAAVTIDTGVYDRVRAFRAPNSRHPKTGLHKRRLSYRRIARAAPRKDHRTIEGAGRLRVADADAAQRHRPPPTGKPPLNRWPEKAKRRRNATPPATARRS